MGTVNDDEDNDREILLFGDSDAPRCYAWALVALLAGMAALVVWALT
jgi:hypothetical protein